jgi:parvulin-like peptidyl-prolyl isomerase
MELYLSKNITGTGGLKLMLLLSKRFYFTALTIALILAFSITVEAEAKDTPRPKPPKVVVATIDGMEITMEEVEVAVHNLMPLMSFHSFVSERKLKAIQKKALNELINNELIYREAKRAKIETTKKEIDEEIAKLKKKLPEGETIADVLKRSNMSKEELKEELGRGILVIKMNKRKTEAFKEQSTALVTDEFVHEYYKKNLDKFKEPEKIHLRSILLKADPSGGQRVWNAARKKAMEIAERARGGEDFAELAKEFSEDPLAKHGGDMGWAHKGSLFDEIDAAASSLEVGEVSEPAMTIYGYHVLKLEGRKPAVQLEYSEINQKKLKTELLSKKYNRLRREWITGLRNNAKIEYMSDIYK